MPLQPSGIQLRVRVKNKGFRIGFAFGFVTLSSLWALTTNFSYDSGPLDSISLRTVAIAQVNTLKRPVDCVDLANSPCRVIFDKNDGEVIKRFTETSVPFWMSFHKREVDGVRWSTFETGLYYEADVTNGAIQILSDDPGGIVVDVGANIGWFTMLGRSLQHEVVAFEPNPMNQIRVCEALDMNDWGPDDVTLYPLGVGNEAARLSLKYGSNPGEGSFKREGGTDAGSVEIVTLDSIAEERRWLSDSVQITLMKVDVEGGDPEVIFGAPRLL